MMKKMLTVLTLFSALCVTPALAQGGLNSRGLPPTRMDSFVRNAGGSADQIYGDEGTSEMPPFFGYTYNHRINAGITGINDRGLTTGHGSYLPSAVGSDEFLGGEFSQSGTNNGNPRNNGAGNPGFDFTNLENQITQLEANITAASDLLTQAQRDLQTALNTLGQSNLTAAQKMAAQIAADDARRQITQLQSSVTRMNSSLSGLDTKLAGKASFAEQF